MRPIDDPFDIEDDEVVPVDDSVDGSNVTRFFSLLPPSGATNVGIVVEDDVDRS